MSDRDESTELKPESETFEMETQSGNKSLGHVVAYCCIPHDARKFGKNSTIEDRVRNRFIF